MNHQLLTNDPDCSRVHKQHGLHDAAEGQVNCISAISIQNRTASTSSHTDGNTTCSNDSSDLRHVVVRLVDRISLLEDRLLRHADPTSEQERSTTQSESEASLISGAGLLGMWQAYLGAGCAPQRAVGIQARVVPGPICDSRPVCRATSETQVNEDLIEELKAAKLSREAALSAYREEHLELQEAQSELAAARAESTCLLEAQQRCTSLSQLILQTDGTFDNQESLQELVEAKSTLNVFRTHIQELEETVATVNDAHAKQAEDSGALIESLHQQLQSSQLQCDDLSGQLASAKSQRAELEACLTEAKAQLEEELAVAKKSLAEAQAEVVDYKQRFLKEREARRQLHDTIQEMRGNIRVVCRVRPRFAKEDRSVVDVLDAEPGTMVVRDDLKARKKRFDFDRICDEQCSQADIFDVRCPPKNLPCHSMMFMQGTVGRGPFEISHAEAVGLLAGDYLVLCALQYVAPSLQSCIDGRHVCIMAYGQTGAGKTYTMSGTPEQPGINTRALQALFGMLDTAHQQQQEQQRPLVEVAVVQFYCEQVFDLLAADSTQRLEVCNLAAGQLARGQERVAGLVWTPVATCDEALAVVATGRSKRATAATDMNEQSSRSHELVTLRITHSDGVKEVVSRLNLLDLAGSERVGRTGAAGSVLKEAQSINKSLSALGDVIAALQAGLPHIPYRNSKLTQVLQDSLQGGSKALLLCNISPEQADVSETLSSLGFAERASKVTLGGTRGNGKGVAALTDRPSQPALRLSSGRRAPSQERVPLQATRLPNVVQEKSDSSL